MRYALLLTMAGIALAQPATAQQTTFAPLQPVSFAAPVIPTQSTPELRALPSLDEPETVSIAPDDDTFTCPEACESSCADRGHLFASVEYLHWRATRAAAPFAGTLTRSSGTFNGLPVNAGASFQSDLFKTPYHHDGAFRLGIGYQMVDDWDFGFRYTYYHTTGGLRLGDPAVETNGFLANRLDRNLANLILDASFDDGEADFASQNLELNFGTYDIEVRHQLCLNSDLFAARLLGGVRFAEIDQVSQISYQNLSGANLLTANTDETMGMSAVGLRAGTEVHYLIGCDFSVFARSAVSLLYADFGVSRLDVQTSATTAGLRSVSIHHRDMIPVTELNVGAHWHNDRYFLSCGYDMAYWFSMVQGLDAIHQDDVDGSRNGYRIERGGLGFDGLLLEGGVQF